MWSRRCVPVRSVPARSRSSAAPRNGSRWSLPLVPSSPILGSWGNLSHRLVGCSDRRVRRRLPSGLQEPPPWGFLPAAGSPLEGSFPMHTPVLFRRASVVVAALVVAVGLTACSSEDEKAAKADPKGTFLSAMFPEDVKQQTVRVSLDTTEDDVAKLLTLTDEAGPADLQSQQMQDVVARIVPTITFTSASQSRGEGLFVEDDPTLVDSYVQVAVDGKPVELLSREGTFALRADVAGIGQATGLFTADQLRFMLPVEGEAAGVVNDLIDGRWLVFPADEAGTGDGVTVPGVAGGGSPAEQMSKFRAALEEHATFTAGGSDDEYGQQVTAKVDAQAFAEALSDEPAAEGEGSPFKEGATVDVVAYVKDGKATRATVDLASALKHVPDWSQAAKDAVNDGFDPAKLAALDFRLGVVAEFDWDAELPTVTDPRTLTVDDLSGLLGGMSGTFESEAPPMDETTTEG